MAFNIKGCLVTAGLCLGIAGTAHAGVQDELDKLFGAMSNVTTPGIHEGQRRGVFTGGRITAKVPIVEPNLVGFTPPSWKGGCGGIDIYGGSFSFINTDQLVQLLRAVAANAKGYAFQLALDNVFPEGAKWIENFQKKVQELNQHLGNSCQLAQGVVNDSISADWFKWEVKGTTDATNKGIVSDFLAGREGTSGSGQSSHEQLKLHASDSYRDNIGNIVWKQLKKNAIASWFQYGDDEMLEALMTLTGTVIIDDLDNDPNLTSGAQTNPIRTLPSGNIKLIDFVSGGSVRVYSCGSDTEICLDAGKPGTDKTLTLKGVDMMIREMLLGNTTSSGIISKYATNVGQITMHERAFLEALPSGVGTVIRNLSVLSPDAAYIFARQASATIALAMVYDFATQSFDAVHHAVNSTETPYKNEALKTIRHARDRLNEEYAVLQDQFGSTRELIQRYNELIDNVRKQKYMLASIGTPPKTKD